jgi:hypothetical protein
LQAKDKKSIKNEQKLWISTSYKVQLKMLLST